MEKIFHTHSNNKNTEVATEKADKIDFEINSTKDKEGLFYNDKSQRQQYITFIKHSHQIYADIEQKMQDSTEQKEDQ